MLFIGDDLLGPVDSRLDPLGRLSSAVVSCGQPYLRHCRAAGSGHSEIIADEVAVLFISLVVEISSNDGQWRRRRGWLMNNARLTWVIEDNAESCHCDVSNWTIPSFGSSSHCPGLAYVRVTLQRLNPSISGRSILSTGLHSGIICTFSENLACHSSQ